MILSLLVLPAASQITDATSFVTSDLAMDEDSKLESIDEDCSRNTRSDP